MGRTILCGLYFGVSSLMIGAAAWAGEDIVVVANEGVAIERVSRSYLRSVFGMRARAWANGETVKVFVLRDNDATHERFCKSILKTFPFNLRKIWDTRVFSGTGQYPSLVSDEEEMYRMISSVENAIGYLSRSNVGGGVKILELEEL